MIYTDAGGFYYTGDVHDATKWMEEHNIWLLVNDMVFLEKQYTKRDVFIYLNRDKPYYTDSPQCMGGLFIIKKCQTGDTFLKKWLELCQNSALITDAPNVYGDNYAEFVDHRHDQSIFSVLRKGEEGVCSRGDIFVGEKGIVKRHHTKYGHIWQIILYEKYGKYGKNLIVTASRYKKDIESKLRRADIK